MAPTKKRKLKSKKSQSRKPFWENMLEWILGFVKKLMIPALILWLITWLWIGGVFAKTGDVIWDGFVGWTASHGLVVQDVVINGRNRTDINNLQSAIKIKPDDALLDVNVGFIQQKIEQLIWVDTVNVKRSYNGILTVDIAERIPFVVWDRHGLGKILVDIAGRPIEDVSVSEFENLLIVGGVDAPKNAADLMTMLVVEENVAKHIKGAQWLGDRRWDLISVNGTKIMLPEDDIGYALSRLSKILVRDLLSIDLRHPDRIIIESKRGAAREDISGTSNQQTMNAI
jgi:cell division protein FtsQ